MSEMVERVALAISGGDDPASILVIHRTRARAAIEAMREPTREMIEAGAIGSGEDSEGVARGAWDAMIDAALK